MKQIIRHPSFNWVLYIVVAYCFLILSTTAAAAVVGSIKSPGANPDGTRDMITLHSEKGDICPDGAKRATYYVGKTKETVEGCYVIRDGVVHMGFVDGDNGRLPQEQFTWVPGNAPSSGNDKPRVGPGGDTNGTPRPRTPIISERGGAKDAASRWM
jgi:hypothetical protein